MNALPRDNIIPASALVVDIEVRLGSDSNTVILQHQHRRQIGIAHELQAQCLNAVVYMHAVAHRGVARYVQIDEQMIVTFFEPLA